MVLPPSIAAIALAGGLAPVGTRYWIQMVDQSLMFEVPKYSLWLPVVAANMSSEVAAAE